MDLARVFDGKKFMWDGRSYDDEQEMNRINQEYLSRGFGATSVIPAPGFNGSLGLGYSF